MTLSHHVVHIVAKKKTTSAKTLTKFEALCYHVCLVGLIQHFGDPHLSCVTWFLIGHGNIVYLGKSGGGRSDD